MITQLPPALAQIRDDFLAVERPERLQLLLEFANELPELPRYYQDHPDLLERVLECQSPVYIFTEIEDGRVRLHATAPREAPTTRGFASIIQQGIEGLSVAEVLDLPEDFPHTLGLTEAVSPLRLSGMGGMLRRIKRQLREKTAA